MTEPPKKINYILSIISISESKKNTSKCVPIGHILELLVDEPWDTLKAQLLVQIDKTLVPSKVDFQDYKISYTIPRILSQPLPLASESDYSFMIKHATKGKVVADVKIECIQLQKVVSVSVRLLRCFNGFRAEAWLVTRRKTRTKRILSRWMMNQTVRMSPRKRRRRRLTM